MPFNSPFTGSRIASIFSQPKTTPPFVSPQPSFPMTGTKRFQTNTLPTPNPVQSDMEEDPSGAAFQRYFDLLQKGSQKGPKQTAYEDALRTAPNRADYAPSKWRRLAAVIGGAAGGLHGGPGQGMEVADYINESPYRGALQDYEVRTGAAEREAQLEAIGRSEYRENLKTAATLGQASGKQFQEGYFKGREQDIDRYKAETERQRAVDQVNRWQAQSRNEEERNELEEMRIGIERGDKASIAAYRARMAGAAEMSAEADKERAGKYTGGGATRLPQVDEQQAARDLALEEMAGDAKWRNFIRPNQDKYGPAYTIDKNTPPEVLQEIDRRVNEKMQMSYPNFGRRGGVDRSNLAPTSSYEIGDLVNPGRQ